MGLNEQTRQVRLQAFLASSPFYAACESGHPFWAGPDREKYKDAADDAKQHDKDNHDGVATAVVLGGT